MVVVPGGVGTRALLEDERLLGWLRDVHACTRFTTSICTGSLLLAAAGLLDGLTATTHWGAEPLAERVVEHLDQRIITAGGCPPASTWRSGCPILVDRTAAEAMQLMIEYDPQPPTSVGRIELAGETLLARLAAYAEDER